MAYNQILEDSTGSEHIIEIKDLCKSFDGTKVLKNITFYIRNNEFITLLGPSGCGKSKAQHQYGLPEICAVPAPRCFRQRGIRT